MFLTYIAYTYIFGFAFFYLTCKLRLLPPPLMMAWFGICFIHMTIAMNLGSLLLTVIPTKFFGASKEQTAKYCTILCKILYTMQVHANPQIQLEIAPEAKKAWADIPPNSCTAINHVSFMDPFLFVSEGPFHYIESCRTMMKANLMDIPVFGPIFARVGHFPVYFKSNEDGNFSVDKERQAPIMEKVKHHVNSGGRLAIFPEGAVNKTPRTLKSFRIGMFTMILELRLPLHYVVTNGNDRTWDAKATIGGLPTTISVRVGQCVVDYDTDDAKSLSERLQKTMQREVDEMYALVDAEKDAKKKK